MIRLRSLLSFLFSGATFAASLNAVAAGLALPIPVPEHPRLYLRAQHVAELPARLQEPLLRPTVERLERLAARSAQFRVEWQALRYLAKPDAKLGRATIDETLQLLKASDLPRQLASQRPDQVGGCRVTGRMMVTGALVYDWLYPLLTKEDKAAFVAELVRLAKTQECQYPPVRGGAITGHNSEAMSLRDMLSAGIAIHDEFPEMYQVTAARLMGEHVPARNWLYAGHAHHQGDSYGPYRYMWDTFALFIFDRMGAGNVFNPEQRFVPYHWLYTTRPDGQRLRNGDTFRDSKPVGVPWDEQLSTLLTASYYQDGVLLSQFLRQGAASDEEVLFELLWRDTALAPKPIEALPLSRYFGGPYGWMVARTSWGQDAVIAEMKINEYNFVNHQHLDAGTFQLYHRGALAIASGSYRLNGVADGYAGVHAKNYYWRTIADNGLLVYDLNENFGEGYSNDGGQRVPNQRREARTLELLLDPANGYRTGRVLAHGFGPDAQAPDYTLLQGDITAAYSEKVRTVTRSFVFLNLRSKAVPAALITLDRVVSSDPSFRKYWLLHSLEKPQVADGGFTIDRTQTGGRGRLNVDVLLPAVDNAQIGTVGGPGKEYWVFGKNYANDVDPAIVARSSMEAGQWRVELSPEQPAAEDLFFTVMQVTDRETGQRWPVRRIDLGERVGCELTGVDAKWIVLLRKDGQRSETRVDFTADGKTRCRFLVTDLVPGRWKAARENGGAPQMVDVGVEGGAAWFEGEGGQWSLVKVPAEG